MRIDRGCLFRACYSMRSSQRHLHLAETQKAEVLKSFIVEKGKGFRYALIRGYWHKKARSGLSMSRTSYIIGLGAYLAFSVEARAKIRGADSYWPNPDHSGLIAAEMWICFVSWLLQKLWVIVLSSCMVWPLSISVFSLSC